MNEVNTSDGVSDSGLIRYIYDFKPCNFSENEVDVLLVDEAHRIQKSSNFMTDKRNEQTYLTQVMSLLYCSKVCVFFIDDHQGIKDDEIGLSSYIEDAANNYADRIKGETHLFINELNNNKEKMVLLKPQLDSLLANRDDYSKDVFQKKYDRLLKRKENLQKCIDKEYQLSDVNSKVQNVTVMSMELKSQFRCNGSDNYLDWLDSILYNVNTDEKLNKISFSNEYYFDICESPAELENRIRELNAPDDNPNQIARLVAGYCWDWSTKLQSNGDLYHDVKIEDWEMPWETNTVRARAPFDKQYAPSADLWASHPMGINQVGCIFSAQGFEVDYVGVIMGPDIAYDIESKKIITVKGHTHSVKDSSLNFDTYIRNIYRVLLSRGRKGCLIYCCDSELKRFFKSLIS